MGKGKGQKWNMSEWNRREKKQKVRGYFQMKHRCGMPSCWLYHTGQKPVTKHVGVTQGYLFHRSGPLGAIVQPAALRGPNEATGYHSKYNRKQLDSFTTEDDNF